MAWTLTTLNVNGLRAATRKGFRDWHAAHGSDVLCLQELKVQRDQMDAEHQAPTGWAAVQSDAEKKGYAGTAVWSRLPARAASTGCGLPWADAEGRIARLDLEPATVVSVYLPSGSSGEARQAMKEAFMDHFLDWSRALLDEGRPVVLCGDLNIAHTELDIHDPVSNKKSSGFLPHERAWFGRLLEAGWVDVWRACHPGRRTYSWWSARGTARAQDKGWRLDYLLASPDLAARAQRAWIAGRDPALSDHCAVSATFAD